MKHLSVLLAVAVIGAMITACAGPNSASTESPAAQGPAGQPEATGQPQADAAASPSGEQVSPPDDTPSAQAADSPTPSPVAVISVDLTILRPYDDPEAMNVLAQLNDWRVSQGLPPFSVNTTLTEIARTQATYLSSLPDLPDDIHQGPDGAYPPERGRRAGWPSYNTPEQIAIDEIGYTGANATAAVAWWKGSSIHTRSVTNPGYREIGVATQPSRYGTLFITVVGSRPNVLPALFDPSAKMLYLGTEQYRYASGARIQQPAQIQILPSAEATIDPAGWQPWQASIPLPDRVSASFAIAFSDGTNTAVTPVSLADDIAWLTPGLSVQSVALAPVQPGSPAAPAAAPTAAPPAVAAVTPTAAPGAAPASGADITLVYGPYSFAVWNNPPGDPVNLSGLEFSGNGATLSTSAWDNEWLGVPLAQFSVGSCLQTWDYAVADPGAPLGCFVRAGIVYSVAPTRLWMGGPFEVRSNGQALQTCPAGPASCGIDLP